MSAEKVAKSIKLLDDNVGKFNWLPANWRELIDLDGLDMDSWIDCILGQLYCKVNLNGDYHHAYEDMSSKGIELDDDAFGGYTYEWIKQIKEGLKMDKDFESGTVWYSGKDTRTILSVHTVNSVKWVTYSWHQPDAVMVNGVRSIKKSQFVTDGYSIKKPARFKKGDKLKSADGTHFYYFTDEKMIKLGATSLNWCDLAYYERVHGKMEKTILSDGDHFFSGDFFWNDNK